MFIIFIMLNAFSQENFNADREHAVMLRLEKNLDSLTFYENKHSGILYTIAKDYTALKKYDTAVNYLIKLAKINPDIDTNLCFDYHFLALHSTSEWDNLKRLLDANYLENNRFVNDLKYSIKLRAILISDQLIRSKIRISRVKKKPKKILDSLLLLMRKTDSINLYKTLKIIDTNYYKSYS